VEQHTPSQLGLVVRQLLRQVKLVTQVLIQLLAVLVLLLLVVVVVGAGLQQEQLRLVMAVLEEEVQIQQYLLVEQEHQDKEIMGVLLFQPGQRQQFLVVAAAVQERLVEMQLVVLAEMAVLVFLPAFPVLP
jgi:hypothetical protein